MSPFLRFRPVMVQEAHRATPFEIFFDLVLVFALTRLISFMADPLDPLTLYQGFLLLLWFWYAWSCYTWLGNLTRADVGLVRAGMLAAMAAIFLAALVIPDAWRHQSEPVRASLVLAVAYIVVRAIHLGIFFQATAGHALYRRQAVRFAVPSVLAWLPLVLGAALGGTAQTVLWTVAFIVDFGGGRIATSASLGEVRSASHFAERHALVMIIALGESLISAGAGVGAEQVNATAIVAALLGFAATACLWSLYFDDAAPAAERVLTDAPAESRRRQQLAADAYTLAHLALIAGVIYFALGLHEVLAHVVDNTGSADRTTTDLGWTVTIVLYGGVVLYLFGRLMFLRLTVRTLVPHLVAIGVLLLLLPVAGVLPAIAAFAVLTAYLLAIVGHERLRRATTASTAT